MNLPRQDEVITLVTGNEGKRREAEALAGRSLRSLGLDLPEIQSADFSAVAAAKALAAAAVVNGWVLVEDSGLSVAAWNGYPGPFTKWAVAAAGEAGFARMLDSFPDRSATAVSVLALARPGFTLPDVSCVRGEVAGMIASFPRGSGGFGWDVLFVLEGESRTFAEMEPAEKNAISHRSQAFSKLRSLLDQVR